MVRFAVVGAGWISQFGFLPALPQTGNATVAALVSGSPAAAGELARFHAIPKVVSYQDFDTLLDSDEIDAVYVALPNGMHADYAIRAARAGKHVMVEKPLAVTVEECRAMIRAAQEAGVFLMTAYRLHHDPGTIEALERIRAGAIGEPRIFTSIFSFQVAPGNHRLKAEHWGGPLQDIGIYCVNAARHIFEDEPVEVSAVSTRGTDPRFAEIDEAVAVTLRFPGGKLAQFSVSFGAEVTETIHVAGTEGELVVDPAYRPEINTRVLVRRAGETVSDFTTPGVDHFAAMIAYFADCIDSGTPPENDGAEGLADVAILRAIEAAARSGRPQAIDLPKRARHPSPETVRHCPRTDRRLVF